MWIRLPADPESTVHDVWESLTAASLGLTIQFLQQIKKEPQESEYLCNDCKPTATLSRLQMHRHGPASPAATAITERVITDAIRTNLAALETVLEAMRTQQPDSQGMDHLRRAADLRTIVAAMLL